MNYTFDARKDIYTELWAGMDIRPERLALVSRQADKIISFKDRYKPIVDATGVPYYIIGLIHLRESNFNFNTHLHNGDPLTGRTYHVPAGRPLTGSPPFSFEESAIDALKQKGYDKIKDWSVERIAYILEKYNGFGYVARGVNSPYLWASTNQYVRGKYIRDGVYSSSTVDSQLGTMAILKVIFDKTQDMPKVSQTQIAVESPKAEPIPIPTKELVQVSRKAWWTKILQYFGIGTGTTTAGFKVADSLNLQATKGFMDGVKAIATEYGPELTVAACAGIVAVTLLLIKYQKEDIAEGRATPSGTTEKEEA
jgi:lysozyme family protein